MNANILIVGVGGQGTLLASRIIGRLAKLNGQEVKLSEVHGMAQRGGSVVTHVKIADKVNSPVVSEGTADFILAFEQLEALRYAAYLKDGGTFVVNTQKIYPIPVITGAAEYPDFVFTRLCERGECVKVDALSLAEEIGNTKCVNVVMLGVLFAHMNVPFELAKQALQECVKPTFLADNVLALQKGYDC